MANFQYQARNSNGGLVKGTLSAASSDAVLGQLRDKGMTPVKIAQLQDKPVKASLLEKLPSFKAAIKPDELILFCQQMGTLLRAGVPIIRSLRGMIEMTPNKAFSKVLQSVVNEIEAGHEFNAAMKQHPKIFSQLFISMIRVGESSGHLDDAFIQIGEYIDQEKQTNDQVKSALRYPSFVVMAMAGAVAVISLYVVPAFEKVFSGAGVELPLATRILMGISTFAQAYWWLILLGVGGAIFGFKRYVKTTKGRIIWGRLKLRTPIFGSILLRATLTRFSRSLSMGISSGVPLVESLRLTGMAVDNPWVQQKIEEMCSAIERGETLTRSATNTKLFTPLVLQMLAVGEETGMVDKMLIDVAGFYEREVQHEIKNLTSAIEPILIIFMGIMVLILAFGVFLPMWDLSTAVKR